MRDNRDNNYESFSISGAAEYEESLKKSKEILSQYKEINQYAPYISVLPIQGHFSHYGESVSYGVIGLSESILQRMQSSENLAENLSGIKIPQKVIDFLLVHESLHTIFSMTFQNLYNQHKDVLHIFHAQILPEIIKSNSELTYNKGYIDEKHHVELAGTYKIEIEMFLQKYFDALKKNMIKEITVGGGSYILPYNFKELLKKYETAEPIAIEILYNEDKQSFVKKIITGMYAGDDLEKRIKSYEDLYREEGMVNYIAGLITGIDIMEVNRYCRQDQEKVNLTQKLQQKGISLEECFAKIKTWQDIINMY